MRMKSMTTINITDQLNRSFLDYASATIQDRALPSLEDGLKPVQRRILYTLYKLGLSSNKPHRKCARVVGEALGKYHPHADKAIYDALVLLAQPYKSNYPLVDGHGNFGSIDGDPPAAMRYTECRMTPISESYFDDIQIANEKDNFDQSTTEPILLPSVLPMILANGSNGIAVGMASSILPHNITELIHAIIRLIQRPNSELKDILKIIKGPDLPTGGRIYAENLEATYASGSGRFKIQSVMHLEGSNLIVTEIPYQVDKTKILEEMAEGINNKRIDNITNLRDESDKDGMRVVIELEDVSKAKETIQTLFDKTKLQTSYTLNSLMLYNGRVVELGLLEILQRYLKYRIKFTKQRLNKKLTDLRIEYTRLEVIMMAVENIDKVIKVIRKSKTQKDAVSGLMKALDATETSAKQILEVRLSRLVQTEAMDIKKKMSALMKELESITTVLGDQKKFKEYLVDEYKTLLKKFKQPRKTSVIQDLTDYKNFLNEKKYKLSVNGSQIIQEGSSYLVGDRILMITNKGRSLVSTVRSLIENPELELQDDERVLYFKKCNNQDVVLVTSDGMVAKVKSLDKSCELMQSDCVVSVFDADNEEIILATKKGMILRCSLQEVRLTKVGVKGVRGITLSSNDEVIGALGCQTQDIVVINSTKNKTKEILVSKIPKQARAKKGFLVFMVNKITGVVNNIAKL